MEVACTRLCCVFGTLLLTGSLVAQTTVVKRTTTGEIKSISSTYVPYGSGESEFSGEYQRKRAPSLADVSHKSDAEKDPAKLDGYLVRRAPSTFVQEREIVAEKKDTTFFPLYSQTVEMRKVGEKENKEVRRVQNRTLPNSYFQQNNSFK